MSRRHGRQRHRVKGVCHVKSSTFTTYEAAMGVVKTTPGAIRAYRGKCCGYYHITSMTQDEYAQKIAELGCTDDEQGGTMVPSNEYEEDNDELRDTGSEPRGAAGGPGASPVERRPSPPITPGSPADVARRLKARRP